MADKEADKIKKEIQKESLGKWYVDRIDGKSDEVVLLGNVMAIIDKHKEKQKVRNEWSIKNAAHAVLMTKIMAVLALILINGTLVRSRIANLRTYRL